MNILDHASPIEHITTEEFCDIVDRHSFAPGNPLYNSNAFVGEAGEVANEVKKFFMATTKPEWGLDAEEFNDKVIVELSDALFYLVRLASDRGVSLEELMLYQVNKLRLQSIEYGRTFLK